MSCVTCSERTKTGASAAIGAPMTTGAAAANQGLEPTAPKGKAKPVAKKPAAKKTAPKGKAKTLLAKSAKK